MKRAFSAYGGRARWVGVLVGVLVNTACSDDDSPSSLSAYDAGLEAGALTSNTTRESPEAGAGTTSSATGTTGNADSSEPLTSSSLDVDASSGQEPDASTSETQSSSEASSTSGLLSTSEVVSTSTSEVLDASTSDVADASTSQTTSTSALTSLSEPLDAGGDANADADADAQDADALDDADVDAGQTMSDDASVDGSVVIDASVDSGTMVDADADACNTCSNSQMDGDETAVDCGGCCNSCLGTACTEDEDCASDLCGGNVCILPVGAAPSLPAGSITSFERFQVASTYVDLPVTLQSSASVAFGNKVYILGGAIDGSTSVAIYEATLDQNGLFESFSINGSYQLATARRNHRADIIGGYIYVFGGRGTSGLLNTVERAPLGANGLAGDFETVAGVTLNTAREYFALITTSGYVYVLGGNYPQLNTVERASVNQLGELTGSFATLARADIDGNTAQDGLKQARWTHATARINDDIYLVGGETMLTIEKTTIEDNGALGNFVLHNPLPSTRNRVNVAILANRMYAFGGWSGGFLSSIAEAEIVNGEVGTWANGALSLEVPVENGTTVQTNAAIYLFGGSNSVARNYIQRAFIQPL